LRSTIRVAFPFPSHDYDDDHEAITTTSPITAPIT
jgi:hypothetical protein